MVSEKLLNALNEQFNYELLSAHYYIGIAAYCADQELDGFANFFMEQAAEERFHAMKIYNYINEVDGRVKVEGISEPQNEFASLAEAFEYALDHERSVTKRFYNIMDIAQEEKEHATISFLQWFIDEQVEEEANMKGILAKLKRLGNESYGIFALDDELAQRVFTPPTNN